MRDNTWLEEKMFELWEDNFEDVPRKNLVIIKFGRGSSRQLGSIKWANKKTRGIRKFMKDHEIQDDKRVSVITITLKFKDENVPEDIVRATIAHEMCHYAHGFNSPLQQIYNHPHKGGVIRKEFEKRGLGQLHKYSKKWLKTNWRKYI
ncbi:MAG: hypothetical protein US52_C0030G0016 [candidate division WS6 bacterium GW2011_GWA2_37_6]|uniref:SprT-like domain-containing protein n=1 Tax=candidate division WS6 bacterium GW2011_GWA2_37_6 TaxID=1619087 RepID=A0A0G0JER1_9BACT|nr:MAG: hypothetical protein US52_C0030G0016 [candidate division WS6 bacterium GW2011_GWA2_37_6]